MRKYVKMIKWSLILNCFLFWYENLSSNLSLSKSNSSRHTTAQINHELHDFFVRWIHGEIWSHICTYGRSLKYMFVWRLFVNVQYSNWQSEN